MSTTGRKRPSREDKRQANRARILRAARTVFSRRGYHGATIEEIADESGLSNGAVYYNFANKEDLFFALVEAWRDELLSGAEAVFAQEAARTSGPPDEQLQDEVRQILRALGPSREWQLLLLEFTSFAARNRRFRRRFVAARQGFKAALAAALERRAAELGVHLDIPPARLTILLTALVNGLAVEQLTELAATPDDLVGDAVAALVRG
jgi:AcrR family transcriptional regulator